MKYNIKNIKENYKGSTLVQVVVDVFVEYGEENTELSIEFGQGSPYELGNKAFIKQTIKNTIKEALKALKVEKKDDKDKTIEKTVEDYELDTGLTITEDDLL